MNETAVIVTGAVFKDGTKKEQMTRSHDTWVLLLVVSVLSTLLSVIVIICCFWVCSKFCINLSFLKFWRPVQCFPNCNPAFPPNQNEFIEMGEIGGKIAELQASNINANYKTGASEQLGYRAGSKNFSLPVLQTPRSWTPSPPFPQTHQNQKCVASVHSACHNCCHNHCHQCPPHHECFITYEEDHSRCRVCESRKRLTNISKYCKDTTTPIHMRGKVSRRSQSALNLPLNLPTASGDFVPVSRPNSSQSSTSKKEEEYIVKDTNNSFSNSVTSKPHSTIGRDYNKNDTNSTCLMDNRKSPTTISTHHGSSNTLSSKKKPRMEALENMSLNDAFKLSTNENNRKPSFRRKLYKGASNKKYQSKHMEKLSMRPNSPFIGRQGSPSSESSDVDSALYRSSGTFWKLYHANDSQKDQTYGEEDSKCDVEPSMSWDHLTPNILTSSEEYLEAKAKVDPSKATAVFHQEKTGDDQNL